jgi:hypothetical protein
MRVDDPSFKQPEPPKQPDYFERNAELIGPRGMLWRDLGALSRGMLTARPGQSPLGMGFTEVLEDREARPFRDARLEELKARTEERKAQADRRKAYGDFIKSLPQDHPLRRYGPFMAPEKLAEKFFDRPGPGMELDPETGKYRVNADWLNAQIQMRSISRASQEHDTALMRNARFISETTGVSLEEGLRIAQQRSQGPMTTDRAAMDDYLKANPGKTAWDYMQEKARLRGGAKPTALMQNSKYLADTLGIPEAEAARIMSQSREQSDSSFYSTIYSRAINSPMVAGDPARAAEIARAAVAARKRFQVQQPGTTGQPAAPSSPPPGWRDTGRRTSDGRPIYTDGTREIAPSR